MATARVNFGACTLPPDEYSISAPTASRVLVAGGETDTPGDISQTVEVYAVLGLAGISARRAGRGGEIWD